MLRSSTQDNGNIFMKPRTNHYIRKVFPSEVHLYLNLKISCKYKKKHYEVKKKIQNVDKAYTKHFKIFLTIKTNYFEFSPLTYKIADLKHETFLSLYIYEKKPESYYSYNNCRTRFIHQNYQKMQNKISF